MEFYTDWCEPCKRLSPILDEIAEEYAGRVNVEKINAYENPDVANKYYVQCVPTVIFLQDAEIMRCEYHFMSKEDLREAIKEIETHC
jgi:thioredoxin 1